MTGPVRLAPAGMLLAATLALVALAFPLDLSGARADPVPLARAIPPAQSPRTAQTPPTAQPPRAAAIPVPGEASVAPVVETTVVVRLRTPALPLPGTREVMEEPSSLYASVSSLSSWPRTHAIASRESLSEISRATGVSVAALTSAGHLSESALLRPGQALVQRTSDASGGEVSLPLRAHTVAQGESLWGISQEAGVSVDAVVAANHLPEHPVLRPGQVLVIPAPEVALIPDSAAVAVSSASWTEFSSPRTRTVAPGDSLWGISQEAGVSLDALMAANNLSEGAVLHSGELLVLPAPDMLSAPDASVRSNAPGSSHRTSFTLGGGEHMSASGTRPRTYTVAYGDTLWDISRDAGVSLGEILAVNQISETDTIHPGDILVLPRGARDPSLPIPSLPTSVISSMDGAPMVWPTPQSQRITSGYGPRKHPIFGKPEFHTGVDIGAHWHADVIAAASGIVRFVGSMGGYGRIIILDHGNGLESAYAHLDVTLVTRGQRVEQRQLIGLVGHTGWSTGPHLLFEIRRNGRPVDPGKPTDYQH